MPTNQKTSEAIRVWLIAKVAAVTRSSPNHIDGKLPLLELGIESYEAAQLLGETRGAAGLEDFPNHCLRMPHDRYVGIPLSPFVARDLVNVF